MQFGTATPVFYEIVFVLLFAMVMVAGGLNALIAFAPSMVISYAVFIASVGGFKSSDAFAMGAGWGVLVMVPVLFSAGIAVGIGTVIRNAVNRGKKKSKD